MVIDPVLTAILVIIGFAAVGAVSPIMNAARSQKKNPELEEKLRLVDERLSLSPDDGDLLIAKAELIMRSGAPISCFESLERAYLSGVDTEKLAPTFWACYQIVSTSPSGSTEAPRNSYFWTRMMEYAPRLTSHFAHSFSDADAKLEDRKAIQSADVQTRNLIVDSVKPRASNLIETSQDENLR